MALLPAQLRKRGEGRQIGEAVQILLASCLHFVLLTKQTDLFYLALVFVRGPSVPEHFHWVIQRGHVCQVTQGSVIFSLLDETKRNERKSATFGIHKQPPETDPESGLTFIVGRIYSHLFYLTPFHNCTRINYPS